MFSRALLLAQALEGLHVDIVVSSSWRFQWELPHLRSLLPAALQVKVRGVTGPAYVGRHARWHEINAYCAAKGVTNWRALDDAFFEFPKDCEQLILCEGGRGLQAPQCESLSAGCSTNDQAVGRSEGSNRSRPRQIKTCQLAQLGCQALRAPYHAGFFCFCAPDCRHRH